MNKGLIIFARAPVPGKVKTRLARDVGDQAAAELYRAMLTDVLESATAFPDVRPLLFWACDDVSIPACPAFPPMESFGQTGTTLGRRMADAFGRAFDSGCGVCCIIGSDSPDLPPDYIRQAFELLEADRSDVVFGPAEDGGYYLLGLRRPCPGLFEDIAWSTSGVLAASLERARGLGLRTSLLPSWYDIDTLGDLQRLRETAGTNAPCTRETAARLLKDRDGVLRSFAATDMRLLPYQGSPSCHRFSSLAPFRRKPCSWNTPWALPPA